MDVVVVDWGADTWKVGTVRRGTPLTLPSPAGAVVGGSISDWNAFRAGLRRTFALVECVPSEVAVLLTVPPQYPTASVRQLQHVCFELGVKLVKVAESPPLALCCEGASSGIVVDIGHCKTCISAVRDGTILDYVTTTKLQGGQNVIEAIQQRFHDLYTTLSVSEAVHILKEHGEIASTPAKMAEVLERAKLGLLPPVNWSRRTSGETFDVSTVASSACEVVFSSTGLNLGALAHDVVARIFATDFKSYSTLAANVILCGGMADVPGLIERLKYELRPWPKLRIAHPTDRGGVYKIWYGAAQLAALPDFLSQCMSIKDVPPVVAVLSSPKAETLTALPPPSVVPAVVPHNSSTAVEEVKSKTNDIERDLQDLKRGVEWDKLKNESQLISFKADLELASLRTGHEVARVVKSAQEEYALESKRQQREHSSLVHAVAAAKSGSVEELQCIVAQLRGDAERTREEQAHRETVLTEALEMQAASDGSEFQRMAESVMVQAEETRRHHAESEARLLSVIQSLIDKQNASAAASQPTHMPSVPVPTPTPEAHSHAVTVVSEAQSSNANAQPQSKQVSEYPPTVSAADSYVSNNAESLSAVLAALPVHPAVRAPQQRYDTQRNVSPARRAGPVFTPSPTPPLTPTKKWQIVHAEDLISARPGAVKEMFASPPPEDSMAGSQARTHSPYKSFAPDEHIFVRDLGTEERAVVVGPYQGANANLIGKGLWWVRVNGGLKRLKPAEVLFADTSTRRPSPAPHSASLYDGFASGVRQVIDFLDKDLSPRTMNGIAAVRRNPEGGVVAYQMPSEDILDFPSDNTDSIPVQTYSPTRVRGLGQRSGPTAALSPPSPTISTRSQAEEGGGSMHSPQLPRGAPPVMYSASTSIPARVGPRGGHSRAAPRNVESEW